MEDLKKLSVGDLVRRLNNIIKHRNDANLSGLEIIAMDYMWNAIVMELWERIPSLKNDPDMQPVLTNIKEVVEKNEKNPIRVKKLEQD